MSLNTIERYALLVILWCSGGLVVQHSGQWEWQLFWLVVGVWAFARLSRPLTITVHDAPDGGSQNV